MLTIEHDLYVRIVELENGPLPRPLSSGFTANTAYRALGLFNPSETSDAYLILSNDRDELWFICNRHLRSAAILRGRADFRIPLHDLAEEAYASQDRKVPGMPVARIRRE